MTLSRHTTRLAVAALSAATLAACTVQDTTAPPLSGPSEMALALRVQAVPDAIYQDGMSQSAITLEAFGPDNRPVRALSVRLEVTRDGVAQDFGTLSSKTVVTGDDGRARVTYTAPPKPFESTGSGVVVTIRATPIGTDFRGESARSVDLRLMPPGVIQPPNDAPVPAFVVTPTPVAVFSAATFDASATSDGGVPCGGACSYSWSFGDGGSGSGMIVSHEFRAPGSFAVTLTVTDNRGLTRSLTQAVTVGASTAPTAAFVFSPTKPLPGQMIFFNASASKAGSGRRIVFYEWGFGSGRTDQGVTVSKGYNTPGTYVVTLKVTDDANQEGTVSQTVPVGVEEEEGSASGTSTSSATRRSPE